MSGPTRSPSAPMDPPSGQDIERGSLLDEMPVAPSSEQALERFFSNDPAAVPQHELDEYMLAWTTEEIEHREELLAAWRLEQAVAPERVTLRRSEIERLEREVAALRCSLRRPDGSEVRVDVGGAIQPCEASAVPMAVTVDAIQVELRRAQRENLLTPLIRIAQKGCIDPWSVAQVWPRVCEMALSGEHYALTGVDPEGVGWMDDTEKQRHLTKEQLRDRLRYMKKSHTLGAPSTSGK